MSTSCATTTPTTKTIWSDVRTEAHLVKHYRLRFEHSYSLRYKEQTYEELPILEFLIPFVGALGFHPQAKGLRRMNMQSQRTILDDLFGTVMTIRSPTTPEAALAKHLAIAAFMYDCGGNVWTEYTKLEILMRMCYNINQNRVRILGKEVYSCITMRFDQYMTASPITPIPWSSIEKMVQSTLSRQAKQKKAGTSTVS